MKNQIQPACFTTFESYRNEVSRLLNERFGIGLGDVCEDSIATSFKGGETPAEHVDYVGEKYDLTDSANLFKH